MINIALRNTRNYLKGEVDHELPTTCKCWEIYNGDNWISTNALSVSVDTIMTDSNTIIASTSPASKEKSVKVAGK